MVDHNLTGQLEKLYDATVYDQNGDKIGGVSQVYLDDESDQPSWATVSTGWFGTKETFVPLDDANFDGGDLRIPYTKDFVKDAPNIDADGHIGESEEAELYRYYSKSYDRGTDRDVTGDRDAAAAGTAGVGTAGVPGQAGDIRDPDDVRGRNLDKDRDRDLAEDRDLDRDLDKDRDGSVVRHEEEVHVGKERVATGRMRLRKHVVTEQKTVTVPVEREEYTLEREPIREGDAKGGKLGEDEVSVTVHEERPVVDKDVVAKERVGLSKETVTDEQQVTTDVSKEEVEVDRDSRRDGTDGDARDDVDRDVRRDKR